MLNFIFGLVKVAACVAWVAIMVFLFITGVAFKIVFAILFGGFAVILLYSMIVAFAIDILSKKDSTKN